MSKLANSYMIINETNANIIKNNVIIIFENKANLISI